MTRIRPMDYNDPAQMNAYCRGIRAAAAFAGEFDSLVHHPCRFEDVILCKFNQRAGKPRRKRRWKAPKHESPETSPVCPDPAS